MGNDIETNDETKKRPAVIDVHHHVVPPNMIKEARAKGMPIPDWNIELDMETMDRLGITGTILSLTLEMPIAVVRQVNNYLGEICYKYPKRYGMFASLPCADPDAALSEIEYACETLHTDGFSLLSNYAGVYLSDDSMDTILSELNARNSVVFLHPNLPGGDKLPLFNRDISVYEYPLDTTRSIMDLVYQEKLQKYPNVRWILSHGGGSIPYLAYRLSIAKEWGGIAQSPEEVLAPLKGLYYELALSASPYAVPAMMELAGPSQILFGTDFPMRTAAGVQESLSFIEGKLGLSPDDQESILAKNTKRLFPRFGD
jgi:predicted TIM-barrel fold metal-dependent hydrolase